MNKAEHEYMNMRPPPPQLSTCYGTGGFTIELDYQQLRLFFTAQSNQQWKT